MGLDANGAKFLLFAKKKGVSFLNTATIGRQSLSVDAATLSSVAVRFGGLFTDADAARIVEQSGGYCEPLLEELGAEQITSFDTSAYEHASEIHDLNAPIGDEFKGRFSAVIDGGTLEHVFNYPLALKNCMEMVEPGGHFLSITPANNFLGHGFYQFSPEVFFSAFRDENGFEIEHMFIFEDLPDAAWYLIRDPREARRRVTLINSWPAYLLVIAKRTAAVEIFRSYPQQSDYEAMWAGDSNPSQGHSASEKGRVGRLPLTALNMLRALISRSLNKVGRDAASFTPFDPFTD